MLINFLIWLGAFQRVLKIAFSNCCLVGGLQRQGFCGATLVEVFLGLIWKKGTTECCQSLLQVFLFIIILKMYRLQR